MPSRINIHFDGNDQNVYYSGETVSGTVEIEFQKVKKVRGISFQIIGFARTNWDGSSFLTQYTYIGKENYLTSRKYLIGSDLDSARDIEPGIYSYNFSCTLPKQLPSSFEGKFGCIRYIAKVTLERPWKFDQTYTVGFTVLRPVDLNLESPLIRVPSEVEVFHQFWCSPCLSKPIHIKGKLQQTGYVPGQTISLLAEVNNASNVDVKEVNIRFQCVISYQADKPRLKCRQDILDLACIKCDPIPKKSSGCFVEKIVIPPVPSSSNSNYSKMIQLSYCVRIEAVTSQFHNNAYVLCPITIGTVPFIPLRQQIIENAEIIRRTLYDDSSPTSADEGYMFPVLSPIRGAEALSEYDIVPPTYQEAVNACRVQVDADETFSVQRSEYVPKYPVYNFEVDSNKTELQQFNIVE